jgi:hypothetical protein
LANAPDFSRHCGLASEWTSSDGGYYRNDGQDNHSQQACAQDGYR